MKKSVKYTLTLVAMTVVISSLVFSFMAEATDLTVTINETADDGYLWEGTGWDDSQAANLAGAFYVGSYTDMTTGLKFENVTIPKGAIIVTSSLRVYVSGGSGLIDILIYGNDADDAVDWVSELPDAMAKTTASSNWLPTVDGIHNINITSIIQEIVDRDNWSSGNSMKFGLYDNSTPNPPITNVVYTEDLSDGGGNEAQLIVTWTYPPKEDPKIKIKSGALKIKSGTLKIK